MNFPELKEEDLTQKVRKIRFWNAWNRLTVWRAVVSFGYYGTPSRINEVNGLEYISMPGNLDCLEFVTGHNCFDRLIPGIISHCGNPKPGDLILYLSDLQHPLHVGVWQEDGKVVSKFGNLGPVIKHRWKQVMPEYGEFVLFCEYEFCEYER